MSLRSKRLASPLDPAASAFLDSTREDAALLELDTRMAAEILAAWDRGESSLRQDPQPALAGA